MINVLIVDDSPVARMTLEAILTEDPEFQVTGCVHNGRAALEFVRQSPPDVITMDVMMPDMNGFEATRAIMETRPVPIVIITSSYKPDEVEKTFKAMEAGAVTILAKPGSITGDEFGAAAANIRRTVKLMSGVKVVRRWPRTRTAPPPPAVPAVPPFPKAGTWDTGNHIRLIAMGASTGGPVAIKEILSKLPPELPVPIALVQHISGEFIDGLIRWLRGAAPFSFHLAREGVIMAPGHVYIAPGNLHMEVDAGLTIHLTGGPPEEGARPSVSHLFRSAAQTLGAQAMGILLTGMGKDGAPGLKALRDAGAHTIAQDRDSCTVYGMPGEAVAIGAARFVFPLLNIPGKITRLLGLTLNTPAITRSNT